MNGKQGVGPDVKLAYPVAPRSNWIDDYHGIPVADPYRELEDTSSSEITAWTAAQNHVALSYLESLPARPAIRQRLQTLFPRTSQGETFTAGQRNFFFRRDGERPDAVLYTWTSYEDVATPLLDLNNYSEDGRVTLVDFSISLDGSFLAYGLSTSGSDWQEWRVRDIATGQDLPDCLSGICYGGAAWTHDHRGFFYTYANIADTGELAYGQQLRYHRLGTCQVDDRLVYNRPDRPDLNVQGTVTRDGRYLVLIVWSGSDIKNLVLVQELTESQTEPIALIADFEARFDVIANDGPIFWLRAEELATQRGRVIAIDIGNPTRSARRQVIAEAAEPLVDIDVIHGRFVAVYLEDARADIRLFELDGTFVGNIPLPGHGTVDSFGPGTGNTLLYTWSSFTTPLTIYQYDFDTGHTTCVSQSPIEANPEAYETKQVFYPSKDGTLVPMFISHRHDVQLTGMNPTYLYGYGGFGELITPHFSAEILTWLDMGGIYVVANIRGGGEYGRHWHQAAIRQRKQVTFDDFIAGAEWLIDAGYTCSAKLAIGGSSNGGLLVAACLTQRPDLFGAAIAVDGLMDMLRFPHYTIGWSWITEYGSPNDVRHFQTLHAYSPLHRISDNVCYPATLIMAGDHDDRVSPAHSFKFVAALQAAQAGHAPILLRLEPDVGHGGGTSESGIVDAALDRLAFLAHVLGMDIGLQLITAIRCDDDH